MNEYNGIQKEIISNNDLYETHTNDTYKSLIKKANDGESIITEESLV